MPLTKSDILRAEKDGNCVKVTSRHVPILHSIPSVFKKASVVIWHSLFVDTVQCSLLSKTSYGPMTWIIEAIQASQKNKRLAGTSSANHKFWNLLAADSSHSASSKLLFFSRWLSSGECFRMFNLWSRGKWRPSPTYFSFVLVKLVPHHAKSTIFTLEQ